MVLSGAIVFVFLIFSLLIYAPTSCTAVETVELILSMQNVFRDGGILQSLAVLVFADLSMVSVNNKMIFEY